MNWFKKLFARKQSSVLRSNGTVHRAVTGVDFFNVDSHDGITTLITDKKDFVLTVNHGNVNYVVNSSESQNDK